MLADPLCQNALNKLQLIEEYLPGNDIPRPSRNHELTPFMGHEQ